MLTKVLLLSLISGMLTAMAFPELAAQIADTTATDHSGNPLDWGKLELLKWAIPLIGSFLYAQWNKVEGWLYGLNNTLKAGLYVVMVTGMMMLGELLNVAVTPNTADWMGTFWEGIASGLIGTLLVKLGIATARTNDTVVAAKTEGF